MEYLILRKKEIRINKNKSIGRVLFIVEGGRTEFNLLKQIFCNILSYDYIEERRNGQKKFINRENKHSQVAVINTFESNITSITDQEENFKNHKYYQMFSMLTIAFLQMGIIVLED